MRTVISNPPFNLKYQGKYKKEIEEYSVPSSNANYGFITQSLENADRAILILPSSVLSTEISAEQQIRQRLIEENKIEAVIVNPDRMFESTSIGTIILILNKKKETASIRMIDARGICTKESREQRGQFGGASHTNRVYKKEMKVFSEEDINEILRLLVSNECFPGKAITVSIEDVKKNDFSLIPSRYIPFEEKQESSRSYLDIVSDINRIIKEKNTLQLTVNESLASKLGLKDIATLKETSNLNADEVNELLKRICGEGIEKEDYLRLSKNKNELKFENKSKDKVSHILIMILQGWKQHLFYLNNEENRLLEELRDKLLPDLMTGKIAADKTCGCS